MKNILLEYKGYKFCDDGTYRHIKFRDPTEYSQFKIENNKIFYKHALSSGFARFSTIDEREEAEIIQAYNLAMCQLMEKIFSIE